MTTIPDPTPSASRRAIGGSDAATVLGISPWQTPTDLWDRLREDPDPLALPPTPEALHLTVGRRVEASLRGLFAEHWDTPVLGGQDTLRHPAHPYLVGHPDAVTADGDLVEIKVAASRGAWGDEDTDAVPQQYYAQALHYLALMRACGLTPRAARFGVLFYPYQLSTFVIDATATADLQDRLIETEVAWWQAHVVEGQQPDPATQRELSARWLTTERTVSLSPEAAAACRQLAELRDARKVIQATESDLRMQVQAEMRDASRALDPATGQVLATWRHDKQLDEKAARTEHLEPYLASVATIQRLDRVALRSAIGSSSYNKLLKAPTDPAATPRKFLPKAKAKGGSRD